MKVAVLTLGCRVNQSESSIIQGTLEENGITIVALKENPDICVVNTCAVTTKSASNSRQLIRRAVKGGARVIVTGCYCQLKKDEVRSIPGAIELVDNTRKFEIVKIITGKENALVFSRFSRSRPHLKVQDGCNFRCSYCIVPLARGSSKSVPLDEIIKRAQIIETAGYNEVVVTGVHLGSYGQDLADKSNLRHLIKSILKFSHLKRIRLSSLEINEVDDELIELLQDIRLCSHIHLPLQSGSDKVLRLMKRNYTLSEFSSKIHKIFSRVDNISIGSDIIVGFPGEEDEEFMDTYNFLKSFPFSYLHIFPFSVRPDTEAGKMKDRVHSHVIKNRLDILMELNRDKKLTYLQKQLHRVLDVIIEEKTSDGYAIGTSGNYIKVSMPFNNARKGSIVFAKISRASENLLEGFIIP
ncbi:MAG: tRNA (N(6)-L-threonylcarbamoyladenosine(37)-C(2))-methylthiotransferase MtaB [Nitrospira bacterium HGW-Nitrospira-1]|nr:MAG: tRNA (N(6)-L-threonylcarbamoyladenosine(37)-C(2))-methylthiotransferase MtaB [Nitrospira bacterium HGW-Nitrospira-1]